MAASWFYPWVDHIRYASQIDVLPNGGRGETFVIRLPRDRVVDTANSPSVLAGFPASVESLPANDRGTVRVEQFKVRNLAGDVIGIAAKHSGSTSAAPGTIESGWVILIPARGALYMAQQEGTRSVGAALAQNGFVAGAAWQGDVRLTLSAGPREESGIVWGGAEEFEGLRGLFSEVWQLTGVDDEGQLAGTIELRTRLQMAP